MDNMIFSKTFTEIYDLWKADNAQLYEKYQEKFPLTNESLEQHPWYEKLVSIMPVFPYLLPEEMSENDYHWPLLLQMLELSDNYLLQVDVEHMKLVSNHQMVPALITVNWGTKKPLATYNHKQITDLFISLVSEMTELLLKTGKSISNEVEVTEITTFRQSYWQLMAEKLKAKEAVSDIISGNDEILKYVDGEGDNIN